MTRRCMKQTEILGQEKITSQEKMSQNVEKIEHDEQLQQKEPGPKAHSKSPRRNNPKSGKDSPPKRQFTSSDTTSRAASQLTPILRKLRRLPYVYIEPGPRSDSTHVDPNSTGVTFVHQRMELITNIPTTPKTTKNHTIP